jgi:hypothetical protein
MRATSAELEITLELSEQECTQLGIGEKLNGILRFMSRNSLRDKSIPVVLQYTKGKREQIRVQSDPGNVYVGNSDRITISIQDYLYAQLNTQGYCGDRFGIGGKVDIFKGNRRRF